MIHIHEYNTHILMGAYYCIMFNFMQDSYLTILKKIEMIKKLHFTPTVVETFITHVSLTCALVRIKGKAKFPLYNISNH